jgi:hypothetical protein
MLDAASAEGLARSFMLGSARQPLPVSEALGGLVDPGDDKAPLKALALLGQRQRYLRRALAVEKPAAPMFADSRALPAPALRTPLLSLLSGKNGRHDDVVAAAIADALSRRGLKLHPFDLPRLDAFAREHRERLGASAIAWAERNAPADEAEDAGASYFFETITESNWRQGRPVQKAAFIRTLRKREPARARDLVVAAFPTEPAQVRLGLLRALAIGLSGEDQPFLETLAKDRAPTVREAATDLLGRLPGSPQSKARLEEAIGRVKTARAGIFRHKRSFSLEQPATIRDWQREGWALSTFAGIGLDQLAGGLGVGIEDLIAGSSEDAALCSVLAIGSALEGRFELIAKLAAGRANVWAVLDRAEDLDLGDEAAVDALAGALVQPGLWTQLPPAFAFAKLYLVTRRALSPFLFKRIIASGTWRAFKANTAATQNTQATETLCALVALAPSAERASLRRELAGLDFAVTGRPQAALALLDQIDAV